jgi:glycosyltransferase involved in cell wall biosynthesis
MAERPQISFVVPLYNEEEMFPLLVERLNQLMDSSPLSIEVVMVNDGSKDDTSELMQIQSLKDHRYQSVFLSKNIGHQLALTAGLTVARATEAVMVIDGDLQDPPELLQEFYGKFMEGYDVVYGVREMRDDEGVFKKWSSRMFYKFLQNITSTNIPANSGDFCLMSRRVVDRLNNMPEHSRFIRGIRAWVGYKQIGVEYERQQRLEGETKYPLKKMLALAYNAIFSFSQAPVKLITNLGLFSLLVSIVYFLVTVFKYFWLGDVVEGFTTLLFFVLFFGGIQMVSLGVIGEYVIRIFNESQGRPLFIISHRIVEGEQVNG